MVLSWIGCLGVALGEMGGKGLSVDCGIWKLVAVLAGDFSVVGWSVGIAALDLQPESIKIPAKIINGIKG